MGVLRDYQNYEEKPVGSVGIGAEVDPVGAQHRDQLEALSKFIQIDLFAVDPDGAIGRNLKPVEPRGFRWALFEIQHQLVRLRWNHEQEGSHKSAQQQREQQLRPHHIRRWIARVLP